MSQVGGPRWYGYPPRPWPPEGWPQQGWPQQGWPDVAVAYGPPPEPVRTYHRMLRVRSYRWWKPLLGVGVLVVSYVALVFGLFVVPSAVAFALGASEASLDDEGSPLVFLLGNLSLAALIPCSMLALWAVHRLRPGFLSSVVGRLRWSWLALCAVLAFVVVLVTLVVSFFLPADATATAGSSVLAPAGTFLALAAVILLTTPLQAAGEEYAFRGYLSQAIGAWVRTPYVPILITSVLFALAHGTQDAPLFLDRLLFGLVAGFLVLRTGGLEASIALHTMNNLVVLLIGSAYADFGEQLTSTSAPWSVLILDGVQLAAFVLVIELVRGPWARRGRLRLTTDGVRNGGAGRA